MKRAARLLAVGVLVCFVVAGCGGPDAPSATTLSAASFTGKPLGEAYRAIGYSDGRTPPDLGVTVYNMTSAVSPERSVGDPGEDWIVIASCYTADGMPTSPQEPAPRIVLGAAPTTYATPRVRTQAQQGVYGARLSECPGTSDTFTVTARS